MLTRAMREPVLTASSTTTLGSSKSHGLQEAVGGEGEAQVRILLFEHQAEVAELRQRGLDLRDADSLVALAQGLGEPGSVVLRLAAHLVGVGFPIIEHVDGDVLGAAIDDLQPAGSTLLDEGRPRLAPPSLLPISDQISQLPMMSVGQSRVHVVVEVVSDLREIDSLLGI